MSILKDKFITNRTEKENINKKIKETHVQPTEQEQNTAQDIFEVKRDDGKTVLIPKVDAFVQKIDGKERLITVTLIEGLTDL